MGWEVVDEISDVGLNLKSLYKELKNNVQMMNIEMQEMKKEKKDTAKEMMKLNSDMKHIKDDYKQCLAALMTETYERNKAEALYKVLKDTREAEVMLKSNDETRKEVNDKKEGQEMSEEDMSVDEDNTEGWTKQRSKIRKKRRSSNCYYICEVCGENYNVEVELEEHRVLKHSTSKVVSFSCDKCTMKCKTDAELTEHRRVSHQNRLSFNCRKCSNNFKTKEELRLHLETEHTEDVQQFDCEKCNMKFRIKDQLKEHFEAIHKDNIKCQKCHKTYETMGKVRRHDWREHRGIECNVCGKWVKSRQAIKKHREDEHGMFRKVFCKYFPTCMDEDECLYEHDKDPKDDESNGYCSRGEECEDQSCNFSERSHKIRRPLCSFQSNCSRLNCPYKHTVSRKAFLELGSSNSKRK